MRTLRSRFRLNYATVVSTVCLFVLLGGGAYAASRLTNATIHACVDSQGHPTVVKAGAACGKGQHALQWNQLGPQGPAGPAGPTGPRGYGGFRGQPGERGPSDVYATANSGSEVHLAGFTHTAVATVSLPAGNYLITGRVEGDNQDGSSQNYQCRLDANYDDSLTNPIDFDGQTFAGDGTSGSVGGSGTLVLTGTAYYTSPGYAILECDTYNGFADSPYLSAIQVGTLH